MCELGAHLLRPLNSFPIRFFCWAQKCDFPNQNKKGKKCATKNRRPFSGQSSLVWGNGFEAQKRGKRQRRRKRRRIRKRQTRRRKRKFCSRLATTTRSRAKGENELKLLWPKSGLLCFSCVFCALLFYVCVFVSLCAQPTAIREWKDKCEKPKQRATTDNGIRKMSIMFREWRFVLCKCERNRKRERAGKNNITVYL